MSADDNAMVSSSAPPAAIQAMKPISRPPAMTLLHT
jgi:hypothetical protein